MSTPAKKRPVPPHDAAVTSGPEGNARSAATPTRGGRKSRAQAALRPYTIFKEPRTGGYYIRYTDPVTKKRERKPLAKAGPGHTATKSSSEAERLATALWQERLEKAGRVANGLEPEREVRPAELAPMYCDWVMEQTYTRQCKRDYVRNMRDVAAHTSFTKVTDVRHFDGPMLRKIAGELRRATYSCRRTRFESVSFTPGMIRARLVTLSAFFAWVAKHHGINMANPVTVSKILGDYPIAVRPADHFYDPKDVDAFLRTVDAWKYTARTIGNREIAYILAYTGARIGEVLLLRADSLDFRQNRITIINSKRTAEEKAQGLRATRTVTMWPRLRSVLLEYVRRHRLVGDDLLFPKFIAASAREKSPKQRPSGPYEWLQKVCAKAGISYKGGHHVWRHTVISVRARMVNRLELPEQPGTYVYTRVTLEQVREEVGHTEESKVTTRVYNHAKLHLPPLALHELDWPVLAQAVRRLEAAQAERFGDGYHEDDVKRMVPLASPPNQGSVQMPASYV